MVLYSAWPKALRAKQASSRKTNLDILGSFHPFLPQRVPSAMNGPARFDIPEKS
jgi:hypothetical protein